MPRTLVLRTLVVCLTAALVACSTSQRDASTRSTTTPPPSEPQAASEPAVVAVVQPPAAKREVAALEGAAKPDAERAQSSPLIADEAAPAGLDVQGSMSNEMYRQESKLAADGVRGLAPAPAMPSSVLPGAPPYVEPAIRERYADLTPNPIQRVSEQPVSTFSIDVDTGSYTNIRRMLGDGRLPPADAVRSEEFLNYFDYGYAPPASTATPFATHVELAPSPWNAGRHLMLVGLKGYEAPASSIPAANLVFLIDSSGSMQSPDKIELLKQGFALLTQSMRPQDRVAIVAYAGSAGVVLPSTGGDRRGDILAALDRLQAGGSTNGGAGIELAYQVAMQNRIAGGINRVILATDGDFNVGTVSVDALKAIVRERREAGVSLTTLGFGRDNYNDELAEQLANIGNGNHAYIDNVAEARRVLVTEMSSTLMTIAKDVKIQIEFNPQQVVEYRLVGYENRLLKREDFNNDRVDAGEIGAGHDVTALYELTLVGSAAESVSPLRYATATGVPVAPALGNELAHLRLRYKAPEGTTSQLIERPITRAEISAQAPPRLQLAATVAGFAERLRGGEHLGGNDYGQLAMWAQQVNLPDPHGARAELVQLINRAATLSSKHYQARGE